MKFTFLIFSFLLINPTSQPAERKVIPQAIFIDKIRGGWAGQYFGATLERQQPIFASLDSSRQVEPSVIYFQPADADYNNLRVDIFPDLLYLAALDEHGAENFEAGVSTRIQTSDFLSGHAFQTAGYNLRGGLNSSSSGRWTNNPHAEDPDFAKTADVLGLIAPGMPRTLSKRSEPIGHMTNTGEGYYGGLYIATLNSLAFVYDKPRDIVKHALKCLPEKSEYRSCLEDVLRQTEQHPNDWKKNWRYLSKEWRKHTGCPLSPSSLERDARIYTAFATMLFLAGEGDLNQTLVVASDFDGAVQALPTVFGLLGVMNGFKSFPASWKTHFESVSDVRFHESLPSLNEACDLTIKHAIKCVEANDGKEKQDGDIVIRLQQPTSHGFERGFEGHYISRVEALNSKIGDQFEFEFEGVGFVLRADQSSVNDNVAFAELYLNNKYVDRIAIPGNKNHSASDLCWRLQLPHKKYRAKIKLLKPATSPALTVTNLVVYDVMPGNY